MNSFFKKMADKIILLEEELRRTNDKKKKTELEKEIEKISLQVLNLGVGKALEFDDYVQKKMYQD